MSSRSVSSKANKPLPLDRDEPDVETYRLPRWDAHGNLIEESRSASATSPEDVDEVEVTLPTAEEIRQIHEDAYNEGFESGYEQGLRQGQQEGQKQGHQEGYAAGEQAGRETGEQAGIEMARAREEGRIEEHLRPVAGVLAELRAVLPAQETELQDGLVSLAVRIARNVIDAELALKPAHIGALVHTAVQALPNADERLTIELNPEDKALVERVADSHWQLQPNADISRGGCVVRTRYSYIDYTLEHRFRQQVSNLLAHIGLSGQLTEYERPWSLPEAETPGDGVEGGHPAASDTPDDADPHGGDSGEPLASAETPSGEAEALAEAVADVPDSGASEAHRRAAGKGNGAAATDATPSQSPAEGVGAGAPGQTSQAEGPNEPGQ